MSSNVSHFATAQFWELYSQLPQEIQYLADKNYELLRNNPRHPSLHFKRVSGLWSVRVGRNFRALGFDETQGIVWFWIGTHEEYNKILKDNPL